MIVFCALLLTLAGAALVYLASMQQRLRAVPLPAAARWAGWVSIAIGTAGWWLAEGAGAGITAALTTVMLAWVTLPYAAWWRAAEEARS